MSLRGAFVLASGTLLLLGVDAQAAGEGGAGAAARAGSPSRLHGAEPASGARVGAVRILTYNVAGLPWVVAGDHPRRAMPRIGELLNHYDIAFVQEDFAWHEQLARSARHGYRVRAGAAGGALYGDGLSAFSALPLAGIDRVAWGTCHGVFSANSDCLASKGFSVAVAALGDGVHVRVVNLHGDAGRRRGDRSSRAQSFVELARYLAREAANEALIVAGDTNLKIAEPGDARTLRRFLRETRLRDACRQLRRGDERIDRVLFRGSSTVALEPVSWELDGRFVDARGRPLSDHAAVAVTLGWRALEFAQPSPLVGASPARRHASSAN